MHNWQEKTWQVYNHQPLMELLTQPAGCMPPEVTPVLGTDCIIVPMLLVLVFAILPSPADGFTFVLLFQQPTKQAELVGTQTL